MNKYLQQLVNLSQIDQKIDNYAPRIESINRNLQLKKDEIVSIDVRVASSLPSSLMLQFIHNFLISFKVKGPLLWRLSRSQT